MLIPSACSWQYSKVDVLGTVTSLIQTLHQSTF